jgi:hypothetical protein
MACEFSSFLRIREFLVFLAPFGHEREDGTRLTRFAKEYNSFCIPLSLSGQEAKPTFGSASVF